jgi:predicted porin
MKKLLIATAALAMVAGTAQAQSSVTVYGVMDMGYSDESKTKTTNATAAKGEETQAKQVSGKAGLSSSRLGFRGTEDLGGGLTAGFTLELGVTTDNAGTPFSSSTSGTRQALVSLSNQSVGSLNFGRGNSLGKNTNDAFTAFAGGGSFEQGSVALEITRGQATADATGAAAFAAGVADRFSNQATYTSPNFSGVTFAAQVVAKSSDSDATAKTGKTDASGTAFQLAYAGNGITAAYTRSDIEAQTEGAAAVTGVVGTTTVAAVAPVAAVVDSKKEFKLDQFGATYTMGSVKLFGLYNTLKYKATAASAEVENKGYDIGATFTMGKTTLLASIGDGEIKTATATTDVKGMQAQIRYELSKRTTAYALYGKTELENATKGESDVTMIGIRHTF